MTHGFSSILAFTFQSVIFSCLEIVAISLEEESGSSEIDHCTIDGTS